MGRDDFSCSAVSASARHLFLEISFLVFICASQDSNVNPKLCPWTLRVFKGPDIFKDAENTSEARATGFFNPRLLRRGNKANTSCSKLVGAGRPVKAG